MKICRPDRNLYFPGVGLVFAGWGSGGGATTLPGGWGTGGCNCGIHGGIHHLGRQDIEAGSDDYHAGQARLSLGRTVRFDLRLMLVGEA
jgi:hypothetical protein